jgi:predicted Zn-dependent peptidase
MSSNLVWHRKILSNGLRILLYPRKSDTTAQLSVAIDYGANLDLEDNAGCAHFLEHMVAGGSKERIELSRSVESLGGFFNPSTNHEYTLYSTVVIPQRIEETSRILATLLFDSNFDGERLEAERKIILNEVADASDNPACRVNQMLRRCLFKNHPVRRDVLGTAKTVRNLSLNEITKAHNYYYMPSNMILIVTGNFAESSIDSILCDFNDRNKWAKIERQKFLEEPKPKKTATSKKPGISQAYISIGARTIPSRHPDSYILDFIKTILGAGASSRFFIEVREKLALTYDISTSHESGLDYGYFTIDCTVKPNNVEHVIEVIQKELRRIRTEEIQEDELDKCKRIITGGTLLTLDSPTDFPEVLAQNEIQFKNQNSLLNYLKKINSITPEVITKNTNKYLREDQLSKAILYPKPK